MGKVEVIDWCPGRKEPEKGHLEAGDGRCNYCGRKTPPPVRRAGFAGTIDRLMREDEETRPK